MKTLFKLQWFNFVKDKSNWIISVILFLFAIIASLSVILTDNTDISESKITNIYTYSTILQQIISFIILSSLISSKTFGIFKDQGLEYVMFSKPMSRKQMYWSSWLTALLFSLLPNILIILVPFTILSFSFKIKWVTFLFIWKFLVFSTITMLIITIFIVSLTSALYTKISRKGLSSLIISSIITSGMLVNILEYSLPRNNIRVTNNYLINKKLDNLDNLSSLNKRNLKLKGFESNYELLNNANISQGDIYKYNLNATNWLKFVHFTNVFTYFSIDMIEMNIQNSIPATNTNFYIKKVDEKEFSKSEIYDLNNNPYILLFNRKVSNNIEDMLKSLASNLVVENYKLDSSIENFLGYGMLNKEVYKELISKLDTKINQIKQNIISSNEYVEFKDSLITKNQRLQYFNNLKEVIAQNLESIIFEYMSKAIKQINVTNLTSETQNYYNNLINATNYSDFVHEINSTSQIGVYSFTNDLLNLISEQIILDTIQQNNQNISPNFYEFTLENSQNIGFYELVNISSGQLVKKIAYKVYPWYFVIILYLSISIGLTFLGSKLYEKKSFNS
ncbi:ABC transporter permease [Mycoplasmopsis lipofaciens]|uniref:ABC transporter permease n=1 Tax=Mycoplasmopsis lipofaciens TaxID=114884 RepID=UPI0004853D49|nr:ABC transporter permease [Mycoplasmopsis lipofaciens]